jgi:hypothetical protein
VTATSDCAGQTSEIGLVKSGRRNKLSKSLFRTGGQSKKTSTEQTANLVAFHLDDFIAFTNKLFQTVLNEPSRIEIKNKNCM